VDARGNRQRRRGKLVSVNAPDWLRLNQAAPKLIAPI
jgi:hypothetical protein